MKCELRFPLMCDTGVGVPGDVVEMPKEVSGPLAQVGGLIEIEEENGGLGVQVVHDRQKSKSKKRKKKGRR